MNEIIITVFFINSNVTVRVVDRKWVVLLLLWRSSAWTSPLSYGEFSGK